MDFFARNVYAEAPFPAPQDDDLSNMEYHDSITTLMNIADKMEAMLLPDLSFEGLPPAAPVANYTRPEGTIPNETFSSVTGDSTTSTLEPSLTVPDSPFRTSPPSYPFPLPAPCDEAAREAAVSPTSVAPHFAPLDLPAGCTELSTSQMPPPPVVTETISPPKTEVRPEPELDAATSIDTATPEQTTPTADIPSPLSVREFPKLRDQSTITKARKPARKPKTYSKPVASRFCHICSRMPRRGQGSAVCRRMSEGLCRKIVCEQCLREQGWDYEAILADSADWLCPHCCNSCPPRSQCHIYNRINARRKRASGAKHSASVAAALASSDALMKPYAHLLVQGETRAPRILLPPPNFRLNLPPEYTLSQR